MKQNAYEEVIILFIKDYECICKYLNSLSVPLYRRMHYPNYYLRLIYVICAKVNFRNPNLYFTNNNFHDSH